MPVLLPWEGSRAHPPRKGGVQGSPTHRPTANACSAMVTNCDNNQAVRRRSAQPSSRADRDASILSSFSSPCKWTENNMLLFSFMTYCLVWSFSCIFSPSNMQDRRCSSCTAFSHHHVGKLRNVPMLFLMSFIRSIFPFCLVPISAFLHISFSFTVLFVMPHKYNFDSISSSFSRLCCLLWTKEDWPEQ